jgi:hypothetical protein
MSLVSSGLLTRFVPRVLGGCAPAGLQVRFATKKAAGSTKNGRESEAKRLGVKKFGGYVIETIPGSRFLAR